MEAITTYRRRVVDWLHARYGSPAQRRAEEAFRKLVEEADVPRVVFGSPEVKVEPDLFYGDLLAIIRVPLCGWVTPADELNVQRALLDFPHVDCIQVSHANGRQAVVHCYNAEGEFVG